MIVVGYVLSGGSHLWLGKRWTTDLSKARVFSSLTEAKQGRAGWREYVYLTVEEARAVILLENL